MIQTTIRTTDPITPAPTKPTATARLVGVDAARGIALIGMIAVHSLNESGVAGKATWSFAIFGGRAAAAFAVLSGVGIAFTTGRRRVRSTAAWGTSVAMIARAMVIGAVGLALGYADAALSMVILPYYAVLFLLAIPLVFLPTWAVVALGVLVAGGAPVLTHALLPHLPVPAMDNPTVGYLVHHPLGLLSELLITGEYPALPWTAYVCAGLVIGRLTLSKLRMAIGLLGTGLVLAFGAAIASATLLNRYGGLAHIWAAQEGSRLTIPETTEMLTLGGDGTTLTSTWWWLVVNAPHTSTPFDLVGTTGAATALLGALLLLGHIAAPPVLRRAIAVGMAPLAAAGSMTLTLYTAHIAFINSDYDTYSPTNGYLLEVTAALLVGLAWRATAGRGPLEALVSGLATRGRRWATSAAREPSRAAATADGDREPAAKPNRDPTPS
jgi:uncharacterized membrane protein